MVIIPTIISIITIIQNVRIENLVKTFSRGDLKVIAIASLLCLLDTFLSDCNHLNHCHHHHHHHHHHPRHHYRRNRHHHHNHCHRHQYHDITHLTSLVSDDLSLLPDVTFVPNQDHLRYILWFGDDKGIPPAIPKMTFFTQCERGGMMIVIVQVYHVEVTANHLHVSSGSVHSFIGIIFCHTETKSSSSPI